MKVDRNLCVNDEVEKDENDEEEAREEEEEETQEEGEDVNRKESKYRYGNGITLPITCNKQNTY